MIKIKRITREGDLSFVRLMPEDYSRLCRDYIDDFGIKLPTAKELDLKNESDLRLLDHPVTITIELKGGGAYVYRFEKGWIHDTASVPSFMRSFIDNDDRRLVLAAMVHDANFRGHWLSFATTNRLFRKMALYADYPRRKAFLAWLAVSSPVGIYRFRQYRKKNRVGKYRRWVHFSRVEK
jgi:hypothetical protein